VGTHARWDLCNFPTAKFPPVEEGIPKTTIGRPRVAGARASGPWGSKIPPEIAIAGWPSAGGQKGAFGG